MASSAEEEDAAGKVPSEVGTDVLPSEYDDTASSSLLSMPNLARAQAQRDDQNQQQGMHMIHASSLTISVWSKHSAIGARQGLLLGRATVPAGYINHPPGDVWLPLADVSNSASATAGREDAHAPALSTFPEHPYTGATTGDATTTGGERSGTKPWGSGLFKRKGPKKSGDAGQHRAVAVGSVRVWLGKARRGSLTGQQPGKAHAVLRVHGASALRKVRLAADQAQQVLAEVCISVLYMARGPSTMFCGNIYVCVFVFLMSAPSLRDPEQADRYGSSDPKCFVIWNGETAGSTSTIYNTTDPCWDRDKEAFRFRLPLDRSLCQLHVDVWDMDFAGTKKG